MKNKAPFYSHSSGTRTNVKSGKKSFGCLSNISAGRASRKLKRRQPARVPRRRGTAPAQSPASLVSKALTWTKLARFDFKCICREDQSVQVSIQRTFIHDWFRPVLKYFWCSNDGEQNFRLFSRAPSLAGKIPETNPLQERSLNIGWPQSIRKAIA